ncbi:carboxymuconolactone decarboxylase family protein [Streptomyces cadmiisoli]
MSHPMPGRRLPKVLPDQMTPEQRTLHEKFSTGRRADPSSPFRLVDGEGCLLGPPEAWVHSPAIGLALEALGDVLEQHAQVSRRSREILILLVAHRRNSAFELYAHKLAGRRAGLSEADLSAMEAGRAPAFQDDDEAAVFELVTSLLAHGTVPDGDYRKAVDSLGLQVVMDVVSLVTYFDLVATHLKVFGIQPPAVSD